MPNSVALWMDACTNGADASGEEAMSQSLRLNRPENSPWGFCQRWRASVAQLGVQRERVLCPHNLVDIHAGGLGGWDRETIEHGNVAVSSLR